MKPRPTREEIAFTLRLPVELHERLAAAASVEKRSRQSHIVYLLDKNIGKKADKREKTK